MTAVNLATNTPLTVHALRIMDDDVLLANIEWAAGAHKNSFTLIALLSEVARRYRLLKEQTNDR